MEFESRAVDTASLGGQPDEWVWMSWTDAFAMPYPQVQRIQLQALQTRFAALKDRVGFLSNLAEEQGVSEIRTLADGALLLFAHSVYKSYPLSLIENARFDKLTAWLGMLTADDLSGLDASGVDTIDDWLELLDRDSNIRIIHSSGTTGKLSFIPRNEREIPLMLRGWRQNFQGFGSEPNAAEIDHYATIPIIFNGYRRGGLGHVLLLNGLQKYLYDGDPSMVLTRNPGRMSADVLSLGGRLSAAALRGEQGQVTLSPKLLERRAAFIEEQAHAEQRGKDFLDSVIDRFAGQRVMMMGNWVYQYNAAKDGLARGLRAVFARNSLIHTAGGLKGITLPQDYRARVYEFLGVDHIYESYGMSEMITLFPKCPCGKHHVSPWIIPYQLDPRTGTLLPTSGTQTGRFGLMDLAATTYWGGFLTGDEVTIDWDGTCPCGRAGPRIHADRIRRYGADEGGDDKVTCAGAPEAHDRALAFITELA